MKSKSILDPSFRYTQSGSTDIRKTFAKERRRLAALAHAQEAAKRDTAVVQLNQRKKG